jgi:hypothetical protein
MLVQPIFTENTPAGRDSAYLDWRQAMLQAHDDGLHGGGLDVSRAAFDAAAIFKPADPIADLRAEIADNKAHIALYESRIKHLWAARPKLRAGYDPRDAMLFAAAGRNALIRSTISFLRLRRDEVAEAEQEIARLQAAPLALAAD